MKIIHSSGINSLRTLLNKKPLQDIVTWLYDYLLYLAKFSPLFLAKFYPEVPNIAETDMYLKLLFLAFSELHIQVVQDSITDVRIQAYLERAKELNVDKIVVNMQTRKKQTPLYLAVLKNKHLIVRVLLKFGADVNTLVQVCGKNLYPFLGQCHEIVTSMNKCLPWPFHVSI